MIENFIGGIVMKKIKLGNIIYNKDEAELSKNGVSLYLSNKECEMMDILIYNKPKKVSKKELENKLWSKDKKDEKIVNMYILYLQQKLLALGANIKISERDGYALESI
mgnify:CR=1